MRPIAAIIEVADGARLKRLRSAKFIYEQGRQELSTHLRERKSEILAEYGERLLEATRECPDKKRGKLLQDAGITESTYRTAVRCFQRLVAASKPPQPQQNKGTPKTNVTNKRSYTPLTDAEEERVERMVQERMKEVKARMQDHEYSAPGSFHQSFIKGLLAEAKLPDVTREFLKLIPFEAARKAYLAAASTYHPDRGGGDAEKMSALNEMWEFLQINLYGGKQ
jgi:hypothetical protein